MKRRLMSLLAMVLALALPAVAGLCAAAAEASGAAAESEAVEGAKATGEAEAAGASEAAGETEAAKPEWRAGMSPAKPYEGVPEVDLRERMGYMIFYPTEKKPAEYSCHRLYVYLPREDVRAGSGKLYLCSQEDGMIWSTAMDDPAAVRQHTLAAAELESLIWGSGTCFEITLPRSLDLGGDYFVNMERGCIVTEDGALDSPEVGGTDTWAFALEGDYGVSGMEYLRTDEAEAEAITVLVPAVGDGIRFDLELGGDAVMAVVYGYNGSVDFPMTMYEQSGEVTGTVTAENPAWGVMFLDKDGNELHKAEFY